MNKEAARLNAILDQFRREEERQQKTDFIHSDLKLAREVFEAQEIGEGPSDIFRLRDMSGRKLTHATAEDYLKWLAGYLKRGGMPTNLNDYPMSRAIDRFYVAEEEFMSAPLYRDNSISIIVPKGVKYLGGNPGQNQIYFMKGFERKGLWVPVFSDTKF
jgi:hypothetical protein